MACKVLVVCGSPVVASVDLLRQLVKGCDHVVAVDRGLDALLGAGLTCDVYVGDADTVSDAGRALVDAAEAFEVERHNPYKDYTDLALALDSVRRRWPGAEVVATCATGGRPDMALSVLGLLAGYVDAPVWIEEDEVTTRILHQDEIWTIEGAEGKTFSIIAIAPNTEISEHGLEWELDRSPLGLLADTGISNVVRKTAKIQVHQGVAIAYLLHQGFIHRPRKTRKAGVAMNLDKPQDSVRGHLLSTYNKVMGCEPKKPMALCEALEGLVSDRACNEKQQPDYESVISNKGISGEEVRRLFSIYEDREETPQGLVNEWIKEQPPLMQNSLRIALQEYTSTVMEPQAESILNIANSLLKEADPSMSPNEIAETVGPQLISNVGPEISKELAKIYVLIATFKTALEG